MGMTSVPSVLINWNRHLQRLLNKHRRAVTLDLSTWFHRPDRRTTMIAAGLLTVAIAALDATTSANVSLGLLYLLPVAIAAVQLKPIEIAGLALLCTFLREQFSPLHWSSGLAPRVTIAFIAYLGTGLLIREMDRHRRTALLDAQKLAHEVKQRETAEQQLRGLIEGTPAAILTLDPTGKVLLANEAAHELFGCPPQSLPGRSIDDYLPDMTRLRQTTGVRHFIRTMIEGTGYRFGGQAFLAHIWLCTYGPPSATGISAVVFDATEQLRAQEEVGLHSLTASARVLLGAFWHETRNLCSAMGVLVTALMESPKVGQTQEIEGLKSLVESFEKLAYAELNPGSEDTTYDTASLRVVLDHLRIVIEPTFEEKRIAIQ